MSQEYEIEKILDFRGNHYLVKWVVFPLHEATWEPETSLTQDCADLLQDFWRSVRAGEIILGDGFNAYKQEVTKQLKGINNCETVQNCSEPVNSQKEPRACLKETSKEGLQILHVEKIQGEVFAIVKKPTLESALGVATRLEEMKLSELDSVWAFLTEQR